MPLNTCNTATLTVCDHECFPAESSRKRHARLYTLEGFLVPAALGRLSEIQLRRVVDHMKERLLDDINEVLKALGSPSLREALLAEVEKHPNLKAHPGPQTIYLQWRIA